MIRGHRQPEPADDRAIARADHQSRRSRVTITGPLAASARAGAGQSWVEQAHGGLVPLHSNAMTNPAGRCRGKRPPLTGEANRGAA